MRDFSNKMAVGFYFVLFLFIYFFYVLDGFAPFLSSTSRLTSFSESKDSLPAPGQYDCTPVKVQ